MIIETSRVVTMNEDFQEEKKKRSYGVNSIQSKLQKAQTGKNTSGQRAYWPGHVLWVFCLLDTLNQGACKQQHDKLKNWNGQLHNFLVS